jgi:hypothetical protein
MTVFAAVLILIGLLAVRDALMGLSDAPKLKRDVLYWRRSYEELVEQTGRDLNDGYGRDPRKPKAEGEKP